MKFNRLQSRHVFDRKSRLCITDVVSLVFELAVWNPPLNEGGGGAIFAGKTLTGSMKSIATFHRNFII